MRLFVLLLLTTSAVAEPVRHLGHDAFRVGLRFEDAVLAPEGRTFALVAYPGLFLLDAASGQVVQCWHFSEPIERVAFDHRGRVLVFDRTGMLRVLEPRSGRTLRTLERPDHGLSRAAFHATGRVMVVSQSFMPERPRQVANNRFVDVESGAPLGWAEDLWIDERWTLSADGTRLAIAWNQEGLTPLLKQINDPARIERMRHLLRVVDTATGKEIYHRRHPKEEMSTLTFTPDGRRLVVTLGLRVLVIDLETGRERELKLAGRPPERGFNEPFLISPDGKRLATCESECAPAQTVVREWDLQTGRLLVRHVTEGVTPLRIGYGAGNRLLVWNTHGCRLNAVDPRVGPILPGVSPAFPLYQIAFTPDGRRLVTLDEKNHVCRWDVSTGRLCTQVDLPTQFEHPDGLMEPVVGVQMTGEGASIALMSQSKVANLDLATGQLGAIRQLGVRGGSCSPDGRWLVGLDAEETEPSRFRLVDQRSGRARLLPELHDLWPGSARGALPTFSSDGRFLAELLWRPDAKRAGSGTACVVVTKTVNGGVLSRVEIPINAGHGRLFFSADSRSFFLGHDGKVSQFEAHSGRLLRLLNPATTEGQLLPLAVSPDGRFILVLATEAGQAHRGDLQVIELLTGTVRKRWSWAQTRASSAMPLFSPDGQTIAMPRDDGTVVLLPVGVDAPSSDRANLWRDLASGDAAIAGAAIESLVAHPDAAGWIRERLADTSPKPDLPVLFWLAELEHEDYDRREAARRTLARQPDRLEELEAALVGPASADLAHTLARLREDRTAPPTADVRRRERLQEALDRLANSSRPPTP